MYSGLLGAFNPTMSQPAAMPGTAGTPWQQLQAARAQQQQGLLSLLQARQTSPGAYYNMGPGSLYYQPWMAQSGLLNPAGAAPGAGPAAAAPAAAAPAAPAAAAPAERIYAPVSRMLTGRAPLGMNIRVGDDINDVTRQYGNEYAPYFGLLLSRGLLSAPSFGQRPSYMPSWG